MRNLKRPIFGMALLIFAQFSMQIAEAQTATPKETFLKYRTSLAAANKIEDLSGYLCKKVLAQIATTPADMKPMMFGFMKESSPHSVQVVSEEVNGDTAILKLTGKTEPAKIDGNAVKETTNGKVTFVKENNEWKIDKESWESKVEVGGGPEPTAPAK